MPALRLQAGRQREGGLMNMQQDPAAMPAVARRRRICAAAAALAVLPLPAWSLRSGAVPRIGLASPVEPGRRDQAFVAGLQELGYTPGRNVELVLRFARGQAQAWPVLIDELLQARVDVLVVGSTIGARAAKAATSSVPIVFAGASDPVAGGLVADLARPEGNLTGFSIGLGDQFAGKWLELLKELAPGMAQAAVLWSPSNAAAAGFVERLREAARTLRVELVVHAAADTRELDVALARIATSPAQGLVVTPSPFAVSQRDRLVAFASERRLPAAYFAEEFVEAGGLLSYGPSYADAYRRAAAYAVRILEGARPRDLPVQQPTRFDLVLNRATARTLGIKLPQTLLVRAERVVE